MPFPDGWPPRYPSGHRNIRFHVAATATANFADRAYIFIDATGANPYTPLPIVRPGGDVSAPDYDGPHDVESPAGTGQQLGDPKPLVWSKGIVVYNYGVTKIEISFDGVNVQGEVLPAASGAPGKLYMDRAEAGIAIRGSGNDFAVTAW